jgi:hypothetical protein
MMSLPCRVLRKNLCSHAIKPHPLRHSESVQPRTHTHTRRKRVRSIAVVHKKGQKHCQRGAPEIEAISQHLKKKSEEQKTLAKKKNGSRETNNNKRKKSSSPALRRKKKQSPTRYVSTQGIKKVKVREREREGRNENNKNKVKKPTWLFPLPVDGKQKRRQKQLRALQRGSCKKKKNALFFSDKRSES